MLCDGYQPERLALFGPLLGVDDYELTAILMREIAIVERELADG